jgi:hypothetical protein
VRRTSRSYPWPFVTQIFHNGQSSRKVSVLTAPHCQLPELVFQQTVGIPMGANFFPLLLDLFMYSNEAGFIQRLLKKYDETIH